MKKFATTAVLAFATLFIDPSAKAGDVLTTSDYFKIRAEFRKHKLTGFQAEKACDIVKGNEAHLRSYVVDVTRSGRISADMDEAVVSVPDIQLRLSDDDQTVKVRQGQMIEYHGDIIACRYDTTFGVLELGIINGRLVKHY